MRITDKVHAIEIPFQIPVTAEKSIDRFVYMLLKLLHIIADSLLLKSFRANLQYKLN